MTVTFYIALTVLGLNSYDANVIKQHTRNCVYASSVSGHLHVIEILPKYTTIILNQCCLYHQIVLMLFICCFFFCFLFCFVFLLKKK